MAKVDVERLVEELDAARSELGDLRSKIREKELQISNLERHPWSQHAFTDGVLAAMGQVLIAMSPERRILLVSPTAEHILGYPGGTLVGKNVSTVFADELPVSLERRFHGDADVQPDFCEESVLVASDGTHVPVLIYTSIVLEDSGELSGVMMGAHDLRQHKCLESRLLRGQKLEAIGQLAAGIAHEINTPIQYIGDNVEFLKVGLIDLFTLIEKYDSVLKGEGTALEDGRKIIQDVKDDIEVDYLIEEAPKAVKQALEGVQNVARIVYSLKAFAHPGTGDMQPHDLKQVIEDVITVSRNEWKYVADVRTEFDPILGYVCCNLGELNQVLLNLIVNAAHAIEEVHQPDAGKQGLIIVRTIKNATTAEIQITDNGKGIPDSVKHKLFDPFFTTKEVGKGTGQGLALAYQMIVEKHNGTIEVQSEPGKTTFTVQLPLTTQEQEE